MVQYGDASVSVSSSRLSSRALLLLWLQEFEAVWFRWLENIRDWCISRQLWWGHRIPAYYVTFKGALLLLQGGVGGGGGALQYLGCRVQPGLGATLDAHQVL